MDRISQERLEVSSREGWRRLHARFLNQLADDGSALVVFDVTFKSPGDSTADHELSAALRRPKKVVLSAGLLDSQHPGVESARPEKPLDLLLDAAGGNWGIARANTFDSSEIVRKHWPFPAEPSNHPSLAWRAAQLAGASLPERPQEQWLRYYRQSGPGEAMSYYLALDKPREFYRGRIVFIGGQPETPAFDGEKDEFRIPYARWTGTSTGGVEIMATQFLNLVNGDWLRRSPPVLECLVVIFIGSLFAVGLSVVGRPLRLWLALGGMVIITMAGVLLSHFTNVWFPWAIVAGGQIPCAWFYSVVTGRRERRRLVNTTSVTTTAEKAVTTTAPTLPDYVLLRKIGRGGCGEIWLAKDATGLTRAVKIVYRDWFDSDEPYHREFRGIQTFMPVSFGHRGLVNVLHVGRNDSERFFYYVMEAADDEATGPCFDSERYTPRVLSAELQRRKHLSPTEIVPLMLDLSEALHFLHGNQLVHRDIKPANIIFVNGRAKLADIGLVAQVAQAQVTRTMIGTEGYLLLESPGTKEADVYALGKVLYVALTGMSAAQFPEMPEGVESDDELFLKLNEITWKACGVDPGNRYASSEQMFHDLRRVAS
jgi:CHASE2 domain-containing sensor protein